MPINVDMSDAQDFTPVPPGTYECVVTNAEERESAKSHLPYIALELTIDGGDCDNRKLFHNLSLSPQSVSFLKRGLIALGYQPDDLVGKVSLEIADLIGSRCQAVTALEDYEGEDRTRVKRIQRSEKTAIKKGASTSGPAGGRKRR